MRRTMFWLSVIAALAGTPMRLAEAASDLARSFAEVDDGADVEEIDGGVGDDAGATIKSDKTSVSFGAAVDQLGAPVGCRCSVLTLVWLHLPGPWLPGPFSFLSHPLVWLFPARPVRVGVGGSRRCLLLCGCHLCLAGWAGSFP